eukprot:8151684-Karenia_brevis.AAC.1
MEAESSREASWSHFRDQSRKWHQRAPERLPGIISGPRAENGARKLQRAASWNHFRAQTRK